MFNSIKWVGAAFALSCGVANAGVIQVGGVGSLANGQTSAKSGVCTVDFNGRNTVNTCGVTYIGANIVSGSNPGVYAAPQGDTSAYLTVGPNNPVTINLATSANYFGFYGGSLDSYNSVVFVLNGVVVDSFNGTTINAVAFPNTGANGENAAYINYFASSFYNQIQYTSSSFAFETDNHAFGTAFPVPEPTSVALLGLGAVALFAGRRRKS